MGRFGREFRRRPYAHSSRISSGKALMATDLPAIFASEATLPATEAEPAHSAWVETALTMLFAAVAVLFASFLAVVTNLV
jgi:hypothetical protein